MINTDKGRKQAPPAEVLMHELTHRKQTQDGTMEDLRHTTDPQFDNASEKQAVQNENKHRQETGQAGSRIDHK